MNPALKLALFAGLLLAMVAGGAFVGSLTKADNPPPPAPTHGHVDR